MPYIYQTLYLRESEKIGEFEKNWRVWKKLESLKIAEFVQVCKVWTFLVSLLLFLELENVWRSNLCWLIWPERLLNMYQKKNGYKISDTDGY